jgi:hypothetical protein
MKIGKRQKFFGPACFFLLRVRCAIRKYPLTEADSDGNGTTRRRKPRETPEI